LTVRRIALLAAAMMLGGANPLAAAGEDAALPVVTPEEDMRCALWASAISGGSEDALEREVYAYAMHLFLGRYEAGSGKDFRPALTEAADAADADAGLLESYGPGCNARWDEFIQRLYQWGTDTREGAEGEAVPLEMEPTA